MSDMVEKNSFMKLQTLSAQLPWSQYQMLLRTENSATRGNLKNMRQLDKLFAILSSLRRELAWTHYRLLLCIEK